MREDLDHLEFFYVYYLVFLILYKLIILIKYIFQSADSHLDEVTLKDYHTDFGVVQWFLETRIEKVR